MVLGKRQRTIDCVRLDDCQDLVTLAARDGANDFARSPAASVHDLGGKDRACAVCDLEPMEPALDLAEVMGSGNDLLPGIAPL